MADDDDMIVDNEPAEPTADNADESTPAQDNQEPQGALIDNDQPESAGSDTRDSDSGNDPADKAGDKDGQPAEEEVPQDEPDKTGNVQDVVPSKSEPRQETPEPVADPGDEFTPKGDYAFDVELADGTKIHVTKPEDIENLPADADFGTPANLMKAQAKLNIMTQGIESERREYEANKEKFEAQQNEAKEVEARAETMVAEMNYLETKGELPPVDAKYENADWSDPEVAKQPGVKERMDLLNYRAEENQMRRQLNLPPMSLLEAHLQMQTDQVAAKEAETKIKQGEQRKAKGAMVGSSNPTPPTNIPDDMIVGEGGSVRDLNPAY